MLLHLLRLVSIAAVTSVASAQAAETLSYPIPWKGMKAADCAVVVDRGNGFTDIILRCKGHLDVVVAEISGEPK